MPDIVLALGPVAFRDFEVPSGICFGGAQRLAVHRLPGGTRVIDVLGRDDSQIRFSGIFSGSEATSRARSLDDLRAAGIALPLTWDVFFFTVLVSDFQVDYQNGWWIPYRVTCTVLRDEASALMLPAVSLSTSILTDIDAAASRAIDGGVDLSSLQDSVATPGAMLRGTTAYTAAQIEMTAAQTAIDGSVAKMDATLSAIHPFNTKTPGDGVAGLLSATNAAGQLSSLTSARAFAYRARKNLANEST